MVSVVWNPGMPMNQPGVNQHRTNEGCACCCWRWGSVLVESDLSMATVMSHVRCTYWDLLVVSCRCGWSNFTTTLWLDGLTKDGTTYQEAGWWLCTDPRAADQKRGENGWENQSASNLSCSTMPSTGYFGELLIFINVLRKGRSRRLFRQWVVPTEHYQSL